VLGIYYMTVDRENDKGQGSLFNTVEEAMLAYDLKKIRMHSRIFVRLGERTQVVPSEKSAAVPIAEEAGRRSRTSASAAIRTT